MPFDTAGNYFYGPEAKTIGETVQSLLTEYFQSKLNAPEAGSFFTSDGRQAVVTGSQDEAHAALTTAPAGAPEGQGTPFVLVLHGPYESHTWGKSIGTTFHEGERRMMSFQIDMSAADHLAARQGPANYDASDRRLIDALSDVMRRGRSDLEALGLFDPELKGDAERQRNESERNPHLFTCFVRLLNDYNP